MMRILVTGSAGMLATDLLAVLAERGHESVGLTRVALDVRDAEAIASALDRHRPDAVVQGAAYTAVDQAESDAEAAFALNATAAGLLAEACAERGIPCVYPSTDYVFDGRASAPYAEDAPTHPLGVYGASKRAGEEAVLAASPKHLVVRTSWLYGRVGRNFVETMRALGRERPELRVVADQVGSPTWTVDLAHRIVDLLEAGGAGVFHGTGGGVTSWHGFAEAIMRLSGLKTPVLPIETKDFPRPAPRPAYSVMGDARAQGLGLAPLPAWETSLARYLASVPAVV